MDEMKSVVQSNDLSGKVIFYGMLPPEELKKKTAEAYIAVNPFERTGLKSILISFKQILRLYSCGIPQVTMNYPEYKKINDQYKIAN